jgi:prepilin-type N-terminal cleavage/methylation domain-containing protein
MKKKRGVTLIELLVSMILLTIMMVAFTNVYIFGMKTYTEQFIQTKLHSDSQTIIDRITTDVNVAAAIEGSYGSYNTGETTLIIKVPALDVNQNFVYASGTMVYDRFIYYQEGNSLHKLTIASSSSTRYSQNNENKTLTTRLTTLAFAYEPDITSPISVTTTITLSQTAGKINKSATLTGKANLRNAL